MNQPLRQCACTLAFMQCIQGNALRRESYGKWCSGGVPKRPFLCEAPPTTHATCPYRAAPCKTNLTPSTTK